MEKSRKAKKNILIILLLVVVGLSIGFAGFASQLTIQNFNATVKGDESSFKVVFSESTTEATGNSATTGGKAQGGTFSGTELTGLTAEFTAPGQTATWELYAFNDGQFDAFLKSVTIGTVTGTALEGTTQSYVDEAIKGIKIKVDVRGEEYTATRGSITSHELAKGQGEKITVTLTYEAGSATADGDFTVNVGKILLDYDSVD